MEGWMDRSPTKGMDGWMDERMDGCINSGQMDMYGWVDHQLKGWMDG